MMERRSDETIRWTCTTWWEAAVVQHRTSTSSFREAFIKLYQNCFNESVSLDQHRTRRVRCMSHLLPRCAGHKAASISTRRSTSIDDSISPVLTPNCTHQSIRIDLWPVYMLYCVPRKTLTITACKRCPPGTRW